MDKEIFLKLIEERLFFQLVLLTFIFMLGWYVSFRLSFSILKVKTGLIKLFPAIIVMTTYSFVKQAIPVPFSGLLMVASSVTLLLIISKTSILRAIWAILITILLNAAGDILILSPVSLNVNTHKFLFETVYGYIISASAELVFSTLALIILSKFPNLSLIPAFRTKPHRLDILCVAGLCFSFYLVYSNSMRLLEYLRKDSVHVQSQLVYEWVSSLSVVFIIYTTFIFIKSDRKEHAAIQRQNEAKVGLLEEQNRRLTSIYEHLSEHLNSSDEEIKGLKETLNNQQDYNTWLIIQTKQKIRSDDDSIPVAHDLTRREIEILRLVALDRSNSEIAAELYLSENTVKKYTSDLLAKLKLSSRLQLALFAFARGFVTEEELKLK